MEVTEDTDTMEKELIKFIQFMNEKGFYFYDGNEKVLTALRREEEKELAIDYVLEYGDKIWDIKEEEVTSITNTRKLEMFDGMLRYSMHCITYEELTSGEKGVMTKAEFKELTKHWAQKEEG